MLNWIKSLAQSKQKDQYEFLNKIFSSEESKEVLLGVKNIVSYEPAAIRRDASRISNFAKTEDYKAFAVEAYLDVIDAVNQLMKSTLHTDEISFQRGRLYQTIHLLKVSYEAHKKLREKSEAEKEQII